MLRCLKVTRILCSLGLATSITACSGGGSGVATPVSNDASVTAATSSTLPDSQSRSMSSMRGTAGAAINTTLTPEMPRSAFSLVDSVGVVTHFHYDKTPYVTQWQTVRNFLIQSRIHHIRDAITTQVSYKPYYGMIADLASNGIRVDGVTLMNEPMSTITEFVTALPNVLESIEAPNEWNLSGDPNWVTDIRAYQKTLYGMVKASPLTSSIPVMGPSLTSYPAYQSVGDLSAYTDQGNMHNYFGANYPGNAGGTPFPVGKYGSIPFFIGSAQLVTATKPVVTTETGYEDLSTDPTPVSAAVKVKYSLRTILEQFNAHVARTFFYELVDEGGQSYGLIDASVTPKPTFVALTSFLGKLSDTGGSAPLTPLSYALTADPSVHHTLVQKRDGSYRLMLWIESKATDPVQQSQTVTVTTAQKFGTVAQYEWQDTGSCKTTTLTQGANNAITLTVSDRVTELKLQP